MWALELEGLNRPAKTLRAWLSATLRHPASSYITILLLQLKVVWGIWWYKDLTGGDTAMYFESASGWFRDFRSTMAQSPLYTLFYGSLLNFSKDSYVVTIAHRLIIVFALAMLVLALMRRLLPPGIAWMMAAWWVVMPINFDALYEVHLFAVIPLLLAILAIFWMPGPWGRGIAMAILLVTAILLRNENLIAVILLAVASILWEIRGPRRDNKTARAYVIPLLAATAVIAVFFWRENEFGFWQQLKEKQVSSVCVSIAYSYIQRVGDFQGSPFSECTQLMQRLFGSPIPSVVEAFRNNPEAMLQHLWWNISLIPAGLQVLLFNYRSGPINPDYVDTSRSSLALIPSLLVIGIMILGGLLLRRKWAFWWETYLKPRAWGLLAFACTASVVLAVAPLNRPRPSYLFIFAIALRALMGMSLFFILTRWPKLRLPLGTIGVVAILAILLTPSIYQAHPSSRPILREYQRVRPYAGQFHYPGTIMAASGWVYELVAYAGPVLLPGRLLRKPS